jgi:hypothetical protein
VAAGRARGHAPPKAQPHRHDGAPASPGGSCARPEHGLRRRLLAADDAVAKQGLLALERDFPQGATDPVNIVVDGAPAEAEQGLTRLRAELAQDRDFAAGALTLTTGDRITLASVPLNREPSSERAS